LSNICENVRWSLKFISDKGFIFGDVYTIHASQIQCQLSWSQKSGSQISSFVNHTELALSANFQILDGEATCTHSVI